MRHGIAQRTSGGRVAISSQRQGENLILSVSDNGPDKSVGGADQIVPRVGLGNVGMRLKTLYKDDQSLAFENNAEGGITVTMTIPFRLLSSSEEES